MRHLWKYEHHFMRCSRCERQKGHGSRASFPCSGELQAWKTAMGLGRYVGSAAHAQDVREQKRSFAPALWE